MAIELDHIELANRNHATLTYLLKDHKSHAEWIATIAFYKAVHITEAIFDHRWSLDSTDHVSRLDRIKRASLPKKYFTHFSILYNKSKLARYLEDSQGAKCKRFSDEMNADLVVSELVRVRLNNLEQLALPMLSDTAKAKLIKIHPPDLPV